MLGLLSALPFFVIASTDDPAEGKSAHFPARIEQKWLPVADILDEWDPHEFEGLIVGLLAYTRPKPTQPIKWSRADAVTMVAFTSVTPATWKEAPGCLLRFHPERKALLVIHRPAVIADVEECLDSLRRHRALARPARGPNVRHNGKYVVPPEGQHILHIARETLGDSLRWPEIYRLNPDIHLTSPIPGGKELRLPMR